jgi:RHS repeat-associated protein
MMAEGWITASFNALNQAIAIWSPAYSGTDVAYFGYDPLGRCVKRWVSDSGDVYSNPATYIHYDGWNLLQEGSNAWGPARVYVHGNRIDEIVWSYNTFTGEQAFHHYDARGHCTLLTDSVGNILEQYEYDAFGQPYFYDSTFQPVGSSTVGNRFLFTGREWLSDLKLYDYRNRMYQPELGRFLQPDPKQFAAGDYNLYRNCHNDPMNKIDPFGLDPVRISNDVDRAARTAGVIVNAITQQDEPGFRLEAGKSIFRLADGSVSISQETVRSNAAQQIFAFPKPPTSHDRTKAEVHAHVRESQDKTTGANTSKGDIKRADITGRPIYTNAPDGRGGVIQERYRPSDAQNVQDRQKEGGIIERYRNGKWERIGK